MLFPWLLAAVPASGLVTTGALLAARVPRRTAVRAGVAAALLTGLALVALVLTAMAECLVEDEERPYSWPWSPRREFCDERSPVAVGSLALLAYPTAVLVVGTAVHRKHGVWLGWTAAALLLTPVLPPLYVSVLPYYELDSYPVLHDPLLRRARGPEPPRVCYVYGIEFGPQKVRVTPDTPRHCVDLEPTPQALNLFPGGTGYGLDTVGNFLTEKGIPVRPGKTDLPGISIDGAYKLTDREARVGAISPDYIPPETDTPTDGEGRAVQPRSAGGSR